jgi:hypothetical protein
MKKIKNLIKNKFPVLVSLIRWVKIKMLKYRRSESIFTTIYTKNEWGDVESVSGPGSNLEQSLGVREALPALLNEFGVRSILDVPCGDFWWMKEVELDVEHYVGADVVKELVDSNVAKYGNDQRKFVSLDITRDNLPQVDLVLCRDLLVHFTYRDIFNALKNLKKSNSEFFLTTTFIGIDDNEDILTGEWRAINLQKPPFNFPAPLKLIDDYDINPKARKSLGLWRISDI